MSEQISQQDLELGHLIRQFEVAVMSAFAAGEVAGTTHTCLGQEYIPVALQKLMTAQDWVFSNHRGHGHYLARHRDPRPLLAEIMGREGAVNGGHGGSQHLKTERFMSTGVQGEGLGLATGVALRLRDSEPGVVAFAYVGDGTFGQGLVYEALNLAALWCLPLVVVVEHNHIAQSTPTNMQMAGTIGGRAAAFDIPHILLDQRHPEQLRGRMEPFLRKVRAGSGPVVIEIDTVRLGPHSKGDDTRSQKELEMLAAQDWLKIHENNFPEASGDASRRAVAWVADALADVRERPLIKVGRTQ